ncbi:MAG: hypothetical protein FWG98_01180 [Candidatus Cloacimonetes bacterium]|nr:hypothetical protein [Candidatus Cloacimonadota bacterium]
MHHKFSSQQGLWQSYVSDHLLPRLNGFEILMAPYTMAHLNLNWTLEKTGFTNENEKRLRVFLTNSLDEFSEGHRGQDRLFSQEADEAGTVKLDTPVMVVLGNPPYSGVSLNKDEWILKKINDYKYTEGVYFNERKHWLNDDYVKFIRLGQDFVDKNKSGVLAYITNHSFLDNPTFRAMRWNLLKSFDKIYIIDLHGSSLKKEITLDGAKDENVFDIMQGVSINIFVKSKPNFSCHCDEHSNQEDSSTRKLTPLAEIFHHDLYGKRKDKFTFLLNNNLYTVPFKKVEPQAPFYFFTPKIFDNKSEYEKGFKINELMEKNVSGIVTMGDGFIINNDKKELFKRINKLVRNEYNKHDLDTKFSLGRNYSKWVLNNISKIIPDENKLIQINYRPFDTRWVYFETNTIWRMRDNIMRHFMNGPNVGLMLCRQQKAGEFHHCFVHRNIVESSYVSNNTSEIGYSFPLYFKPEKENKFAQPNMNMAIVQKIANHIGKQSVTTKQFFSYAISDENNELTPINIFDYIYARLHSPSYREKYKEFLKIDFPRVPYPVNADEFWHYVKVGRRLRKLHLMDGVQSDYQIANFNIAGDNSIDKPKYINIDDEIGKVYINETQYFDNVPLVAWEFYIGGYQPAQKWLKDRKGKALSYDDVIHYQKIIQVLQKTETIMKDIDDIEGKKV